MNKNKLESLGKLLVVVGIILGTIAFVLVLTRKYNEKFEQSNNKLKLSSKYPVVWPKPRGLYTVSNNTKNINGLTINTKENMLSNRFSQLNFPKGSTIINVTIKYPNNTDLDIGIDESYKLNYSGNTIEINSNNKYGAMHALTTLRQLVRTDDDNKNYIPENITISDSPKFSYRGVLIDTGRVYLPIDLITRTIDGMAFVKLNVLHWHLTDAQTFPYEPPSNPKLSKGSTGKIYSQQDIIDITEYAKNRSVIVMIEIDTPAHTYSWGVSHPDLMACTDIGSQSHSSCQEPPCGSLDITDDTKLPQIQKLVKEVFDDVIKATSQNYVHIGGDELKKGCVPDCKPVNNCNIQTKFEEYVKNLTDSLHSKGKKVIMWEDILGPYLDGSVVDPNINKNIIMETWTGDHSQQILKLGYKIISTGTHWYLDVGRNAFFLDNPSWAMWASWQSMYNHDVTKNIDEDLVQNILGGEVCIWGETIDETNFDSLAWPRSSTVAEVLWSDPPFNEEHAQKGISPYTGKYKTRLMDSSNNLTDVWNRFKYHREDLLQLGIGAEPVGPPFCTQNPEICNAYSNSPDRNTTVWPNVPFSCPGPMSYCTPADPCLAPGKKDLKNTSQLGNKDSSGDCDKESTLMNGECVKTIDFNNGGVVSGDCPKNLMPVVQIGDDWGPHTFCMGASQNEANKDFKKPAVGLQQNKPTGQFEATMCYDTNGWTIYNNFVDGAPYEDTSMLAQREGEQRSQGHGWAWGPEWG